MKTTPSLRISCVLLAMVVLAFGSSSRAQSVCYGTFVLPFEVQWNGSTLPAGQYQFTLPSANFGGVLIIRDARGNAKLFALTTGRFQSSSDSGLVVLNTNGKHYVSSLTLKPIGMALTYSLPAQNKALRRELTASSQLIPVHIVKG